MTTPPQSIWWDRIGRSLRYVAAISSRFQEGISFLLDASIGIPWEETFQARVRQYALRFYSERMLRVHEPGMGDPGRYCLTKCCPKAFQNGYWPTRSVAAYLCEDVTLTFHKCFFWIKCPPDEVVQNRWEDFILEYEQEAGRKNLPMKAVFLLETPLFPEEVFHELPIVRYGISTGDCRVFCMELIEELSQDMEDVTEYSDYLAELAVQVGQNNPEICSALLNRPLDFLRNPLRIGELAWMTVPDSGQGRKDADIFRMIWKAQLVWLYPLLEQERLEFIKNYARILKNYLPMTGAGDAKIEDPEDLEFGTLYYLYRKNNLVFSRQEQLLLDLGRNARNLLAHNNPLSFEEVGELLDVMR